VGVLSLLNLPTTAAFPAFLSGRLPHYPFRGRAPTAGWSSVHSRFGLHVRRVAQGDPLHRRLRQVRHLPCRSDCYRLERPVAGRESHPLKTAAFSRRTKSSVLRSKRMIGPPQNTQPSGPRRTSPTHSIGRDSRGQSRLRKTIGGTRYPVHELLHNG